MAPTEVKVCLPMSQCHNLPRCILTNAAYTVHFHYDVWQSTAVEEMTLRMNHLQWSSHQACALYVHAKYCFLTYLFKVPKSLYKQFPDELQRAYPLLWKLCKVVNKAWCAQCSSVKMERERSDCWAHRNTANKKHVSSGEFNTCSLHFAHEVNLLLKLKNQSLYTIQLPKILIIKLVRCCAKHISQIIYMKFCILNKLWSSHFKHFGININKGYQTHVTGKAPADHAAQEGPQAYRLQ